MTKIANETVKRLYNEKGQPRKDVPFNRTPPLPLVPETFSKDDLDLRKKGSYMLKVDPAIETSADFKFTMYHVDGTESLRTTIQWYKDVWQVIKGLGLEGNPEGMIPFVQATCHGSANAAFQDVLQGLRAEISHLREEQEVGQLVRDEDDDDDLWNEMLREEEEAARAAGMVLTKAHVDEAVRAVISNASPYKVLQKQKRYMRRYMRKPSDMKIRTFVHNLMKLNHEELPYLPPFGSNQKLSDDDIIEIILNASPNSWSNEMDRQNFDPLDHTVRELLSFCERIEQLEPTSTTNGSVTKKHDHNKRSKNSSEKGKPTGKWCTFHKTDSHDSSECKVLLNKDKAKPSYGNKTWKRKAEEGKSYSKEELNSIVKKVVDEARKSWTQKGKDKDKGTKRKKEEANLMEDESHTTTTEHSCDSEVTQEDLDELDRQLEEVGLNDTNHETSDDEFSV
jgi:hypothetical protein